MARRGAVVTVALVGAVLIAGGWRPPVLACGGDGAPDAAIHPDAVTTIPVDAGPFVDGNLTGVLDAGLPFDAGQDAGR